MTYGCLGIHQSSTFQRYHIYRLIEYIRHMFTMESPRGNLLIQMQLILACKVHILVRFFVLESFSIHTGDFWFFQSFSMYRLVSASLREKFVLLLASPLRYTLKGKLLLTLLFVEFSSRCCLELFSCCLYGGI